MILTTIGALYPRQVCRAVVSVWLLGWFVLDVGFWPLRVRDVQHWRSLYRRQAELDQGSNCSTSRSSGFCRIRASRTPMPGPREGRPRRLRGPRPRCCRPSPRWSTRLPDIFGAVGRGQDLRGSAGAARRHLPQPGVRRCLTPPNPARRTTRLRVGQQDEPARQAGRGFLAAD